jgi:surface antigen
MRLAAALLIGPMLLAGCAAYGPKEAGGGLLGAAGGGLLGAQFGSGEGRLASTAAGVLLGGLLGSSAGRSLDRADRLYMQQATFDTLERAPSGYATRWRNPSSGNWGTITPVQTYRAPGGSFCREYQQTIVVGGRLQEGYGTACRQPDGSWLVVD